MWPDVKDDIQAMLYGDSNTKPQGHWVLLRWFDVGNYSKYWDANAGQAIGGPKWKYWDFPLKTTYQLLSNNGGGQGPLGANSQWVGVPGDIDNAVRLYLLQRCYKPKDGDIIMEYENCPIFDNDQLFVEHARTNKATPYRVKHSEQIRVDDNTPQYYLTWAVLDNKQL